MSNVLKNYTKRILSYHRPGNMPNIFVHSLPRSGSTWVMELILTQPSFLGCNEPLNLRSEIVRHQLGMTAWNELHDDSAQDKLLRYFRDLSSGCLRDKRFYRYAPIAGFRRLITSRIVFKIIHGAEEHVNWLSSKCNGRVLYLLRHPVPVTLSRTDFPKLDTILKTKFRDFFDIHQLNLADRIIRSDNKFARGMLDWSLRSSVALRSQRDDWTILAYEQLVQNPGPLIDHVSKRLELPDPQSMLSRLRVPSTSTSLSDKDTRAALGTQRNDEQSRWLVEKWRERVSDDDLKIGDDIINTFHLDDVYSVYHALPNPRYWIV